MRTGGWLSLDHGALRMWTGGQGRQAPAGYWEMQHEVGNWGVGGNTKSDTREWGAPWGQITETGGHLRSDTREWGHLRSDTRERGHLGSDTRERGAPQDQIPGRGGQLGVRYQGEGGTSGQIPGRGGTSGLETRGLD